MTWPFVRASRLEAAKQLAQELAKKLQDSQAEAGALKIELLKAQADAQTSKAVSDSLLVASQGMPWRKRKVIAEAYLASLPGDEELHVTKESN